MSMGGGGAMTCGGCGFSACGGCGSMMAPGLTSCGSCGWSFGHRNRESITDDAAAYKANEAALDKLEASGQGDSAMADAARAGMKAAQYKIVAGVIGFVVFLIILLVILSHMHSQSPNGLGSLAPHLVALATHAGVRVGT
jgi:hypothetical protein